MKYGQLVIGPAGSGKSTYCYNLEQHCEVIGRNVRLVNLDPAAEYFEYKADVDVRELISIEDVMDDDELRFGPNGGLIFCMEFLMENVAWLEKELECEDDAYFIFDCPGQIELYSHLPVMVDLLKILDHLDFVVGTVFVLDSQFLIEPVKYFGGVLAALSAMLHLNRPHVNVATKIDLLTDEEKQKFDSILEEDIKEAMLSDASLSGFSSKYNALNGALCKLIEDYNIVSFFPLDVREEDAIGDLLTVIDNFIQYGEDHDVKDKLKNNDDDE